MKKIITFSCIIFALAAGSYGQTSADWDARYQLAKNEALKRYPEIGIEGSLFLRAVKDTADSGPGE